MSVDERIDDEFKTYLSSAAFVSKNTINSYKNSHSRLTDYLGMPIIEAKSDEIIDAIDNLAANPNTQASLLNCALTFYKLFGIDTNALLKEKTNIGNKIIEHKAKMEEKRADTLPSMEEVNKHLKKLFVEQRWGDFIVMWLMVNYNTRNADVDVEIVNSIHQTKKDKKRNYLVRRKHDFVYIRNNYKTFKTYKQKRFTFKSVLMSRAVKHFVAQQPPDMPVYVINYKGERMNEGSIGNYIKRILPNGITEGDLNKIQVSEIVDMAEYPKLISMAERRGTEVTTLINHYHIPFQTVWKKK